MGKDLYVTNISFQATEEDLRKLFSVAGTVRSVNLLTDPKTGLLKGNGFVRMASEAEAKEAAVILDGALLINREIAVSLALDKAERAGQAPPEERPGKGKGRKGGRR